MSYTLLFKVVQGMGIGVIGHHPLLCLSRKLISKIMTQETVIPITIIHIIIIHFYILASYWLSCDEYAIAVR